MPGNKKNKRKAAQAKKAATDGTVPFQNPNAFDPKAINGGKGGGKGNTPSFSPRPQRKSSQRGR